LGLRFQYFSRLGQPRFAEGENEIFCSGNREKGRVNGGFVFGVCTFCDAVRKYFSRLGQPRFAGAKTKYFVRVIAKKGV